MRPFEKWFLWISTALAGGSGAAYFWVAYTMEPARPWDAVNHPLQPWLLKAHVLTAPLLLFALGLVTANHIWRHFSEGAPGGRKTGVTAMLALVPMVSTGYLIQVVTHPGWLAAIGWAHVVTSALFLAGFLFHGLLFAPGKVLGPRGRSSRNGRHSRPNGGRHARNDGGRRDAPGRCAPNSESRRTAGPAGGGAARTNGQKRGVTPASDLRSGRASTSGRPSRAS